MNNTNINNSENKSNTEYRKIRSPTGGFILKKDVYTTNLLYADDRFSKKVILKNLKFRKPLRKIPKNINKSLIITHENFDSFGNTYEENESYTNLKKKSKKIWNKIHLPLPRIINPKSMSYFNLNKNFCGKDVKIRFMDDDLNITSNKGRKINYNFKGNNANNYFYTEKNISYDLNENNIKKRINNKSKASSNFNKSKNNYVKLNDFYKIDYRPRFRCNKHLFMNKNENNMMPLNLLTSMINSNLKNIMKEDKENKKLMFRNDFFKTQVKASNKISYKKKKLFI